MMPPHITSVQPPPNSILSQDTIIIQGYSLDYAQAPVVVDRTTGKEIPIQIDIQVEIEGDVEQEEPVMGSIQEHSCVSIKLLQLQPNHVYQLTYLNETFEWSII